MLYVREDGRLRLAVLLQSGGGPRGCGAHQAGARGRVEGGARGDCEPSAGRERGGRRRKQQRRQEGRRRLRDFVGRSRGFSVRTQ